MPAETPQRCPTVHVGSGLRCGRQADHDGIHHPASVADDGSTIWIYQDHDGTLYGGAHLDLAAGRVTDADVVVLDALLYPSETRQPGVDA